MIARAKYRIVVGQAIQIQILKIFKDYLKLEIYDESEFQDDKQFNWQFQNKKLLRLKFQTGDNYKEDGTFFDIQDLIIYLLQKQFIEKAEESASNQYKIKKYQEAYKIYDQYEEKKTQKLLQYVKKLLKYQCKDFVKHYQQDSKIFLNTIKSEEYKIKQIILNMKQILKEEDIKFIKEMIQLKQQLIQQNNNNDLKKLQNIIKFIQSQYQNKFQSVKHYRNKLRYKDQDQNNTQWIIQNFGPFNITKPLEKKKLEEKDQSIKPYSSIGRLYRINKKNQKILLCHGFFVTPKQIMTVMSAIKDQNQLFFTNLQFIIKQKNYPITKITYYVNNKNIAILSTAIQSQNFLIVNQRNFSDEKILEVVTDSYDQKNKLMQDNHYTFLQNDKLNFCDHVFKKEQYGTPIFINNIIHRLVGIVIGNQNYTETGCIFSSNFKRTLRNIHIKELVEEIPKLNNNQLVDQNIQVISNKIYPHRYKCLPKEKPKVLQLYQQILQQNFENKDLQQIDKRIVNIKIFLTDVQKQFLGIFINTNLIITHYGPFLNNVPEIESAYFQFSFQNSNRKYDIDLNELRFVRNQASKLNFVLIKVSVKFNLQLPELKFETGFVEQKQKLRFYKIKEQAISKRRKSVDVSKKYQDCLGLVIYNPNPDQYRLYAITHQKMKKVNQFQNRFSQQSVKGIQRVKKQVVLDQNFKKITYQYFKESQNLQKLKQSKDFVGQIHFQGNMLQNLGILYLVRFGFTNVCKLYLDGNQIQDVGIYYLFTRRQYENFQQVQSQQNMNQTPIWQYLRILSLRDNYITVYGLKQILAYNYEFPMIEKINLRQNQVRQSHLNITIFQKEKEILERQVFHTSSSLIEAVEKEQIKWRKIIKFK